MSRRQQFLKEFIQKQKQLNEGRDEIVDDELQESPGYDSDKDPQWDPLGTQRKKFTKPNQDAGSSVFRVSNENEYPPIKKKKITHEPRQRAIGPRPQKPSTLTPKLAKRPCPGITSTSCGSFAIDPDLTAAKSSSAKSQDPDDDSDFEENCGEIDNLNEDNAHVSLLMALQDMEREELMEELIDDDLDGVETQEEWGEFTGRQKTFEFTGQEGLQGGDRPINMTPLEVFNLLVDDEVLELIVTETNQFAARLKIKKADKKFARISRWTDTNRAEIKKFLILTIWMGLVPIGRVADYWAKNSVIYKFDYPQSIMPRNRYELILATIHFNNNLAMETGDRLGKISPLLTLLQKKYQANYTPGEKFVVDETLIPWRGRLVFKQYIPNKAHKYGIKLFKLCAQNGYTWAVRIYSGKSASGIRETGLATNVCLQLSEGLLDQGRTLYVDNFYTSMALAKTLLDKKTHLVGTVRANRKELPKAVMNAKLKKGQMISQENALGIVVLKWRDTRDVRMLSTKHEPKMVELSDTRRMQRSRAETDAGGSREENDTRGAREETDVQGSREETDAQGSREETDAQGSREETDVQGSREETDAQGSREENDTRGAREKTYAGESREEIDAGGAREEHGAGESREEIDAGGSREETDAGESREEIDAGESREGHLAGREETNEERNIQRRSGRRQTNKKPLAVVSYNKGKSGIDLSDQKASYANPTRKGIKWFRKLGLELLIGMSVVNAWVLYKEITNKTISIRKFREELVRTSPNEAHETTTPASSQGSRDTPTIGQGGNNTPTIGQASRNTPTIGQRSSNTLNSTQRPKIRHDLEQRRTANGRLVRRQCVSCYAKLQRQVGRIEARKKGKMTNTFCTGCNQQWLCLQCYNERHQ